LTQLLKKIFKLGILRIIAAAVVFLFNLVLARELGSNQAGLFFLGLSAISLLSVFVRIGLDNILLREIAANWKNNDREIVKGDWIKGMTCIWVASIATSLTVYTFSPWLSTEIFDKPMLAPILQWMSLGIPLFASIFIVGFSFQAIEKHHLLILLQNMGFQLPILLILLIHGGNNALQLSLLWLITVLVLSVTASAYFFKNFLGVTAKYRPFRELLLPAIPLWWMQMLQVFQIFGIPLMLGMFVTSSEVAWFYAAMKIATLVSLILTVVNISIAPEFSIHSRSGNQAELEKISKRAVMLTLLLASPVFLIIFSVPSWLLSFFGHDFINATTSLRVLAIGQLVAISTGPVGYLLMMTNNEKRVSQTASINALLLIILCIVLLPTYGINGAAYAITLSMIVVNLLNVFWVQRELQFNPMIFWR